MNIIDNNILSERTRDVNLKKEVECPGNKLVKNFLNQRQKIAKEPIFFLFQKHQFWKV